MSDRSREAMRERAREQRKTGRAATPEEITASAMHAALRKKCGPPQEGGWCWSHKTMMWSHPWRALSRAARLVVDRILLEHIDQGGGSNGSLTVTFADFQTFGVNKKQITWAIKEAEALGFIRITVRGIGALAGDDRRAQQYALTWMPATDGPATNRWKTIDSPEAAEQVKAAIAAMQTRKRTMRKISEGGDRKHRVLPPRRTRQAA